MSYLCADTKRKAASLVHGNWRMGVEALERADHLVHENARANFERGRPKRMNEYPEFIQLGEKTMSWKEYEDHRNGFVPKYDQPVTIRWMEKDQMWHTFTSDNPQKLQGIYNTLYARYTSRDILELEVRQELGTIKGE